MCSGVLHISLNSDKKRKCQLSRKGKQQEIFSSARQLPHEFFKIKSTEHSPRPLIAIANPQSHNFQTVQQSRVTFFQSFRDSIIAHGKHGFILVLSSPPQKTHEKEAKLQQVQVLALRSGHPTTSPLSHVTRNYCLEF